MKDKQSEVVEEMVSHEHHKSHEMHRTAEHHGHAHSEGHKSMAKDFRNRFLISAILSIPVLLLSPIIQKLLNYTWSFTNDNYLVLGLSAVIFFYGGAPFLKGFVDEIREKRPGMMTLIGVAITVAFIYSISVISGVSGELLFFELVTLIDVMLLGHWIEMRSVSRASSSLEALAKLMPSIAHVVKQGGMIIDTPLSEVRAGDIIIIKPDEKIPADGIILKGETNTNESMLTGESLPVNKAKGSEVIGGSINLDAVIYVKIMRAGSEMYISQIIKIVKKAQESKSKTQNIADKAALVLTILAFFVGIASLGIWLALGKEFAFALERFVSIIVIACPHALGLAIPLAVAVSVNISVKRGLLIKNRDVFEKSRNLDAVVFDKTGTLTKADFGVSEIISSGRYLPDDILFYAASLEINSVHPIARAILKKAKARNITLASVNKFSVLAGRGVKGIIGGKEILLAGYNYLKEKKAVIKNAKIEELINQGKTLSFLFIENKIAGVLALKDVIRNESKEAVQKLKAMGIKCYMITGDHENVAKLVSDELGLDGYFAQVLPHEKSEIIKRLQEQGMKVGMVGDGVNDAPALTQADSGIAIGAGTDVAIESADIILVKNDPRDVVSAIKLARATYRKMVQNLFWATAYNVAAIPLAAGVLYSRGILLSPALGALFMSLSTIIVAFNSLWLRVRR